MWCYVPPVDDNIDVVNNNELNFLAHRNLARGPSWLGSSTLFAPLRSTDDIADDLSSTCVETVIESFSFQGLRLDKIYNIGYVRILSDSQYPVQDVVIEVDGKECARNVGFLLPRALFRCNAQGSRVTLRRDNFEYTSMKICDIQIYGNGTGTACSSS